jgi:hypothetical protein
MPSSAQHSFGGECCQRGQMTHLGRRSKLPFTVCSNSLCARPCLNHSRKPSVWGGHGVQISLLTLQKLEKLRSANMSKDSDLALKWRFFKYSIKGNVQGSKFSRKNRLRQGTSNISVGYVYQGCTQ